MMRETGRSGRILAIDPGRRRTGIALSDPSATLSSPLETVELPPRRLVTHVLSLIERHGIRVVVIGLPRLPSGEKGEVAQLAEDIGERLRQSGAVEVAYWDEALTSWEARSILHAQGARPPRKSRGRRRRAAGAIDRLAAALILQDYLDSRHPRPEDTGRAAERTDGQG